MEVNPVIIAFTGSRDFSDIFAVRRVIRRLPEGSVVHVGDCPTGADYMVRALAPYHGFETWVYPADWRGQGRAAGPLQNKAILDWGVPQRVVAFVQGDLELSFGTLDMVRRAKKRGLPVNQIRSKMAPLKPRKT